MKKSKMTIRMQISSVRMMKTGTFIEKYKKMMVALKRRKKTKCNYRS